MNYKETTLEPQLKTIMKKDPKIYITSDIHGNLKGFIQALERCDFDLDSDILIINGDLNDGHPDSASLIQYLIDIFPDPDRLFNSDRLILIRGNHENFLAEWLRTGVIPPEWEINGGMSTIKSYNKFLSTNPELLDNHLKFLRMMNDYYIYSSAEGDYLIVHAGFNNTIPIANQKSHNRLFRDRWIWKACLQALKEKDTSFHVDSIEKFSKIFIGHSTTPDRLPNFVGNVVNTDTAAGSDGKVTIMNIDTLEYYQSDYTSFLYKNLWYEQED